MFRRHRTWLLVGLAILVNVPILAWLAHDPVIHRLWPSPIVIAAGREGSDSYLFGHALAAVLDGSPRFASVLTTDLGLGRHVSAVAMETRGTDESLFLLEGSEGPVNFAFAQLDVVEDPADDLHLEEARVVATVFEDKVQLLACTEDPNPTWSAISARALHGPTPLRVYLPTGQGSREEAGGQEHTLRALAAVQLLRIGTSAEDHLVIDAAPTVPACDLAANPELRDALVFRVRLPGSADVSDAVQKGWVFVALDGLDAFVEAHHAYRQVYLEAGTYHRVGAEGRRPVPATPVPTLAIPRVLLARNDVEDWIVQGVTEVVNHDGQDIAQEMKRLYPASAEGTLIPRLNFVPSLNARFQGPEGEISAGTVPLHDGAVAHYNPNRVWYAELNQYADLLQLSLEFLVVPSVTLVLFLLGQWRQRQKDSADIYTTQVTRLKQMFEPPDPHGATLSEPMEEADVRAVADLEARLRARRQESAAERSRSDPMQLALQALDGPDHFRSAVEAELAALREARDRWNVLNQIFREVTQKLTGEKLSETSFSTFDKTYNNTRRVIDDAVEGHQRTIARLFVIELMALLGPNHADRPVAAAQQRLEALRTAGTAVLLHELIHSRESLRTFLDAYEHVRSVLAARGLHKP